MIPNWSAAHTSTVRAWYGQVPTKRLSQQMRKPEAEIELVAEKLGLKRPAANDGEPVVREPSPQAKAVDRFLTEGVVEPAPNQIRVPKPKREPKPKVKARQPIYRPWTLEEEALLEKIYPHSTSEQLEAIFKKSGNGIVFKANSMGLKKTPETIALIAQTRNKKRRQDLVELLRKATTHVRAGDSFTALYVLDQALEKVGAVA